MFPTADKHYVPDIHHAEPLDAFDAVLQRIHGAWTRHCGANQPLWCTQLPVLILHIELVHGSKTHDPTADKHYVPDIHHAEPLDAFDAVLQSAFMVRGLDIVAQISRFGAPNYRF